jgi:hypothetical protein
MPASCWFLAWLILQPYRKRRHFPPKYLLTFTGLHGAISQKIEFFKTTALRASDPTFKNIPGDEHYSETVRVEHSNKVYLLTFIINLR